MKDNSIFKIRMDFPLEMKILLSELRIKEWIEKWGIDNVHLNYSGGKDSEVLRHLINDTTKKYFPMGNVKKVFCNTLNENPDNVRHIIRQRKKDNIIIIYPKKRIKEIIETYGFPAPSKKIAGSIYRYKLNPSKNEWRLNKKRADGYIPAIWRDFIKEDAPAISDYCCSHLKTNAIKKWAKKNNSYPFIGIRASESKTRKDNYIKNGCNNYDAKEPQSWPIAFWTIDDIDKYVVQNAIKISKAYETEHRTGCMACLFGIRYDHDRFYRMKEQYPRWWKYVMEDLEFRPVLRFIEKALKLPPGRLIGELRLFDAKCNKCCHQWKTTISDASVDICPKCSSTDID
jgi:3'-phosphoadenosine 5'-phosphosulfate sulfotransferase (PAPS reductase)/FAD synthetase